VEVIAFSHLPEVHARQLLVCLIAVFGNVGEDFLHQLKRVGPQRGKIAYQAPILPKLEIDIETVVRIRNDLSEARGDVQDKEYE
jgi:hypothetical protein